MLDCETCIHATVTSGTVVNYLGGHSISIQSGGTNTVCHNKKIDSIDLITGICSGYEKNITCIGEDIVVI